MSLQQDFVDALPEPLGVWPLTFETGVKDVSDNRWKTTQANLGFSSAWIPSNVVGSALFAADEIPDGESYMEVEFDVRPLFQRKYARYQI